MDDDPIGTIRREREVRRRDDWRLCDGGEMHRAAPLYAVAGTRYGAGDGHSTFNVPNLLPKRFWVKFQ